MKNVKYIAACVLTSVFAIGNMQECLMASELREDVLASDEKLYYIGDADGNGEIGLSDVQEILRHILHIRDGYSNYDLLENKRLVFTEDMDEDGKVTWKDATLVLRKVMHMDEVSVAEIISTERNQGYEIIYEPRDQEQRDDIFTITSREEFIKLLDFLGGSQEEYQKELMVRYEGIFDKYNLLVVKAGVFTDNTEDVTMSVVRRGNHVLAEASSNQIPREAAEYQYAKFLCVDKDINDDCTMGMEYDGIVGRADIFMMQFDESHGMDKDKNTVGFNEATPYGHLLKNADEVGEYRQFLSKRFDVNQTYFGKLSSSFFRNHAYAVFTYQARRGGDEYRVLGMDCIDGVLHVKLQWYDESQGAPGFVAGTYGVFVSVPADMAAQASTVELEVIPENGM